MVYIISITLFSIFLSLILDIFSVIASSSHPASTTKLILNKPTEIGIGLIKDDSCAKTVCFPEILEILKEIIKDDTGVNPKVVYFSNMSEVNRYEEKLWKEENFDRSKLLLFAYNINASSNFSSGEINIVHHQFPIVMKLYNSVSDTMTLIQRAIIQYTGNTSMTVSSYSKEDVSEFVSEAKVIPLLLGITIMCFPSIYFSKCDIFSPRRPYLLLYRMNLFAYWIGTYIADVIFVIPYVVIT